MPEIKKPSKLHKAGTMITKPIRATVRTTRKYVVNSLVSLDSSTEGAVRQALQTAKIEAEQQLRQTDTGQAAVAAAHFLGQTSQNIRQYNESAKNYHGTRKQVGTKVKYARAPAKRELKQVQKHRNSALTKETSLHNAAKQSNLSYRSYISARTQVQTDLVQGRIGARQYQKRILKLQKTYKVNPGAPKIQKVTKVKGKNAKPLTRQHFSGNQAKTVKVLKKQEKRLTKGQKKGMSAQNKAFRKFKKSSKRATKADKKLFKSQQKIRKLSKPKSESGKMIVQSVKQAIRQRAAQDAGDDETAQAALKVTEYAAAHAKQGGRKAKLRREMKREPKLKKRAGTADQKLKQRQSQLHKSSLANKQHKKAPKTHRSAKEFAQDTVRAISNAVKSIAGHMVIPLVLVTFFCFSCTAPLTAILNFATNSLWMAGTFNALDKDLSDAEKYYLEQAFALNEHVILCGGSSSWKGGLLSFGIDTSTYSKTPAVFTNTSTAADAFEFDVWKLWAYLCAYMYTYDANAKESEMWELDDEAKYAMDLLLLNQYEFIHTYHADGYWERVVSDFTDATFTSFFSAGNAEVMQDVYSFVPAALPAALAAFAEDHTGSDGTYWIICKQDNHEILNANDGFSATGWYMTADVADLVSHTAHYIQYYEWINTTALEYGMHKKKSLETAIHDILSHMSDDLYEYYQVLASGSQTESGEPIKLYGGHQAIRSPLNESMRSLMESNRIMHNFGKDMPTGLQWGTMHCDQGTSRYVHDGIDIICNSNVAVYSMFTGEITDIGTGAIQIMTNDEQWLHIWINTDDLMALRATYCAVTPLSTLSEGDIVQEGQLIGYTTSDKKCEKRRGFWTGWDYLHITLELKYDTWTFKEIDPRLLIS